MMRLHRLPPLLLASMALLPAQRAQAAPRSVAEAAYAGAQRAFDANDCRTALRAFAGAYKLLPLPRALLHIGHCYRRLGDLDSAAGAYALLIKKHEASALARRARDLLLVVEGERSRRKARKPEALAPPVLDSPPQLPNEELGPPVIPPSITSSSARRLDQPLVFSKAARSPLASVSVGPMPQ